MKVKYTITAIREEPIGSGGWEKAFDKESLKKQIEEYIKEDVSYIMDDVFGQDSDTIEVEVL